MNADEVAAGVEGFIRDRFQVPADDEAFTRGVNLWEEGYVDSIGLVELIGFIESSYGIVLPDGSFFDPDFTCIDGIARVVCRLRTPGERDDGAHDEAASSVS
jgi:acyl carrier protein